ncbi:MAG: GNAT family N-acetyltransferase [Bacteroidaceae bacterium]
MGTSDKEATKALWNLCFTESKAFTKLYFAERYSDCMNETIRSSKGNLISALQLIPYPMNFGGEQITTYYVSGACTHPKYQGKGVMKQLLIQSFKKMWREDVMLTTLIPAHPWLFDYYGKSGYTRIFDYSGQPMSISTDSYIPLSSTIAENEILIYQPSMQKEVYTFFDYCMADRDRTILHTVDDFRIILLDAEISGGKLLVARSGGEINGLLFVDMIKDKIVGNECLLRDNEHTLHDLFRKASLLWGVRHSMECLRPATDTDRHPLGMARIIHAYRMLALYAAEHSDLNVRIRVEDELLLENNGCYELKEGICRRIEDNCGDDCLNVGIPLLTRLLLGYRTTALVPEYHVFEEYNPWMSLMLN